MSESFSAPSRRSLLRALALAPVGAGLAAPAWAETAAAAAGLIAPTVCLLTPELTEGPFYVDPRLERADVAEGRPGAPVALAIQVVDAACAPVAGARVDIWQCDALGVYSGVGAAAGETFLRGFQTTGAGGVARFRSIYPGWYAGRTAHVHYKVILGGGWTLTSQLFLPDALSEFIYREVAPYAERGARRRTFNRNDRIAVAAGAGAFAAVTERADRYEVALVVGVDASAPPPAPDGSGDWPGPAPMRRAPG